MARYNRWQNENLYSAADTLDDAARRLDRGSFFESIHATLSHILWADELWMSRLAEWTAPSGTSRELPLYDDWQDLKQRRAEADLKFIAWSDKLKQSDIDGALDWYSGTLKRGMTSPRGSFVPQGFNHTPHQRGNVHATLTGAGAWRADRDIAPRVDQCR